MGERLSEKESFKMRVEGAHCSGAR